MKENLSISKVFGQMLNALKPEPISAESTIKLAERRAEDVLDMLHDLENMEREATQGDKGLFQGVFAKTRLSLSVENTQGYIEYIKENASMLATQLKDFAVEDDDMHDRLSGVHQTFEEGINRFSSFVKRHAPDRKIADTSVSMGYLSNVVKMYEVDRRPRAPVIPIRDGIDIDG